MKALISPNENGRVVEIASAPFPVAQPLFWVEAPFMVNTDWRYVDGEFVAPSKPEPVNPIPSIVSMRQARLALLQSNLLAQVDAAVSAGTEADKITWEYATEVNRNDTLVQNLSVALNLTEQDLDNLFTLAASL